MRLGVPGGEQEIKELSAALVPSPPRDCVDSFLCPSLSASPHLFFTSRIVSFSWFFSIWCRALTFFCLISFGFWLNVRPFSASHTALSLSLSVSSSFIQTPTIFSLSRSLWSNHLSWFPETTWKHMLCAPRYSLIKHVCCTPKSQTPCTSPTAIGRGAPFPPRPLDKIDPEHSSPCTCQLRWKHRGFLGKHLLLCCTEQASIPAPGLGRCRSEMTALSAALLRSCA